jgi:hypothetical protein
MLSGLRARRDAAFRVLLAVSLCMGAQNSLRTLAAQAITSGIDLLVVAPAGQAIPKAKITLTDGLGEILANGLTDYLGQFSVSQVPPGAYTITVALNGFKSQEKTLLVERNQITELNLTLQNEVPILPGPGLVLDFLHHGDSGIDLVVKDQSGAVIADAKVTIAQVDTGASLEGRTTQVGGFRATGLAAGKYIFWVERPGFKKLKSSTEISAHDQLEIAITLQLGPPLVLGPSVEALVRTLPATLDSELIPELSVPAAPPTPSVQPSSGPTSNPFRRLFYGLRRMLRL